jgi:hypothetical protein
MAGSGSFESTRRRASGRLVTHPQSNKFQASKSARLELRSVAGFVDPDIVPRTLAW